MIERGRLDAECDLLCHYLTGLPATPYARDRYAAGHQRLATAVTDPLDAVLLGSAMHGGLRLRMADAYARQLRPSGLLRRKLVLALAILESAPPTHQMLNMATTGSRPRIAARVALSLAGSLLALLAGLLWYGPRHLLLTVGRGRAAG